MSASATQGGHNEGPKQLKLGHISDLDLKGHLVRSAMFHKNDLCCFSVWRIALTLRFKLKIFTWIFMFYFQI